MGYSFFFLLGLKGYPKHIAEKAYVDDDKTFDNYLDEIVQLVLFYRKTWTKEENGLIPYFVDSIGRKELGSAGPWSCGGDEMKVEISKVFELVSEKFPETEFTLYHFFYDCPSMSSYTFKAGKLVHEFHQPETIIDTGKAKIQVGYSIKGTIIPGNVSMLFNEDYYWDVDVKL